METQWALAVSYFGGDDENSINFVSFYEGKESTEVCLCSTFFVSIPLLLQSLFVPYDFYLCLFHSTSICSSLA